MRYLQHPNSLTDQEEYFAHDIDDVSLSSNTKGFVKTLIRLFGEDESNEAKTKDEKNQIELANNNQKNSIFERLQAHVKHFTDSTHIQSDTLFGDTCRLQTMTK